MRQTMNPQKGRTAMEPGLFTREWSGVEQRHQEFLKEAAIRTLIRNARADDPQPTHVSLRFSIVSTIGKVLRTFAHASPQPMGLGPRGFRDGLM
jgi:hypothetical protein